MRADEARRAFSNSVDGAINRRGVLASLAGGALSAATGCARTAETLHRCDDGYAVTAQYYDLVAEGMWRDKLAPAMVRVLSGFTPGDDWVLDIGAGTGLSTAALLRSIPSARVLAIEPDPSMRAGLMTRVMADATLQRQVSILPSGLFEAELPVRFAGAVMVSAIHHFTPTDRRRLWVRLAGGLKPGGRAAIEIQIPVNTPLPRTPYASRRIGDIDYGGWMQADPVGASLQRWQILYRATRGGRVLDERLASYDMHVVSHTEIQREVAELPLRAVRDGDFIVLHANR